MARFYEAPDWRFVVTKLDSTVLTFLDGRAMNRQVTYTLDQPAVATMDVPSADPEINIVQGGDPFVAMSNRLLFGFRREGGSPPWVVRFAGIIMQPNDEVTPQTDPAITHLTAFDPWQYLMNRPVLNASGLLPGSAGLSYTGTEPQNIVKDLLTNAALGGPAGGPAGPSDDLFLDFGQTAFYGGNLNTVHITPTVDVNFKQGMMVGEALSQLVGMGACDIVLNPIWDPVNRPGICCEVNAYLLAGAQQPGAVFSWDKPGRSLNGLNRLEDGTQMVNYPQFYAGQGGSPVPVPSSDSGTASIAKYGPYWQQTFFPGYEELPEMVQLLASATLAQQNQGKRTVSMSPAPEFGPVLFSDYNLGDQVPVYASSNFRKELAPRFTSVGWLDFMRIYAIPVVIPNDSPEVVNELLLASPFT